MRKNLWISTLLASAVCFNAFSISHAIAGPNQVVNGPLRAEKTPQILSPGQINPEDAQGEAKQVDLGPPASKEERANASRGDIVSQARFWVREFAKNPKDEEAAFQAANSLGLIGSFEKATETAAYGLQYSENSGRLWKTLGVALLNQNKASDASRAFTKAISLLPKDAQLHNLLGVAYDNMENYTLSQQSYNEARALDPSNMNFVSNQGFSLMLAGRLAEAEALLKSVAYQPNAPVQARQNLALAVGLQGRLQESEQIAASDLSPEMAKANIQYLKEMLDGEARWNKQAQTNK